jgi:hypothetical protein
MPEAKPPYRVNVILVGIFVCALLTHFWLATRNWKAGFMPGHEFRQTQTALISHFIDRENNFSLLYETPIVGKPWVSILLEVPVYEWSVVLVSRATGWSHVVSARAVTLACFYLTLPALWLLFRRMGLPPDRRLLPLMLILLCPVYIFYSRAFLMESMELMCCAWFLVGYVGMMERRRWPWFLLATVAGTGASLIKSATFAVWLIPAAACAAWMLWGDLRSRDRWRASLQTVFWGLAGVTVPLGALRLWIELTDPIKAAHASAWIFTSANLSLGNWGLNDLTARFSASVWGTLLDRWSEALMPPWLVIAMLLTGLVLLPAQRRQIAGLAAVFFMAQLLFPFAYAYQEYYFYACAVFLLGGFGWILHGLLESGLPRWLCWPLIAVVPAAQLHTYWHFYFPQQMVRSDGGFSYTLTLRDFTPRESVIVVAGADWAAMVPLYTERRALMIRNGLEHDRAYLDRAFNDLWDEDVSALVLLGDQRNNGALRDLAVAAFGLDQIPTFSHRYADVYCSRRYSDAVRRGLEQRGNYGDIKVPSPVPPIPASTDIVRVNEGLARSMLSAISPAPLKARFSFGMGRLLYEGEEVLNAHPDSDVWLRPPTGASRIEWDYGMITSAWERAGDKTDGVEMLIIGLRPGLGEREIFRRELDPVLREGDRGKQREVIRYEPLPGEILHFSTRPRAGLAYDWTYWARIEVK